MNKEFKKYKKEFDKAKEKIEWNNPYHIIGILLLIAMLGIIIGPILVFLSKVAMFGLIGYGAYLFIKHYKKDNLETSSKKQKEAKENE